MNRLTILEIAELSKQAFATDKPFYVYGKKFEAAKQAYKGKPTPGTRKWVDTAAQTLRSYLYAHYEVVEETA